MGRLVLATAVVGLSFAGFLIGDSDVAARPAGGNTWSGTWQNSAPDGSFWVFSQSGDSVGGVWKGSGSSGTLTGRIQGSSLSGTLANNEAKQSASFSIALAPDGHSFSGTFTIVGGSTGQWRATCTSGACLSNSGGGGPAVTGPAVKLSGLARKVEVQRNSGAWEPADASMTLRQGDRIHTGWKSGATLVFPDGSTVAVKPMTMMSIEKVETGPSGATVKVVLKLGEITVDVTPSLGSSADFDVKTPTTTAGARGTVFSVLYDGGSTIVSVRQGTVAVKPNAGPSVDVTAGREVSSSASTVSKPVGIGKAGAPPGSVGPARAVRLLTSALAKGFKACKVDADSIVLKRSGRGWRATVKIVGARRGSAVWTITGTKVRAANALAKRIAAGCR